MKKRRFTGTTNKMPMAYEQPHRELARRAAAEGFVLLKNENGILPLAEGSSVALYGAGASQTIKGGTGSGDVNERESVCIYQGMKSAGFCITDEDWIEAYDRMYVESRAVWREEIRRKQKSSGGKEMDFFTAYSSTPYYLPAGPKVTKTQTDTAIYIISRIAGENKDRVCGEGDYQLSAEENTMLGEICALYPKVIVAVNTGGLIDLSFMDQYSNIYALLQIMQPGMEGGHAFADIIRGKVTPAGKLTDSWALAYGDYPNSATFSHNNGNVEEEKYEEGIYMGYRYFDSFSVPVRYCFGYGLSYTSFAVETKAFRLVDISQESAGKSCERKEEAEGSGQAEGLAGAESRQARNGMAVELEVCVTNTGTIYYGREVVQVYVSLPEGNLEKEYRRLCAFAKTKHLAPGKSQKLSIRFSAEQMASYHERGADWELEEGFYGIWVGTSLENAQLTGMIEQKEKSILYRTENLFPLKAELHERSLAAKDRASRYQKWVNQAREEALPVLEADNETWKAEGQHPQNFLQRETNLAEMDKEAETLVSRLTTEQCIQMVCGASNLNAGVSLGASGIAVPGTAGETSSCAEDQGIAAISLADGPAGLRLNAQYSVKDGKILPLPFEASVEKGYFCEALAAAEDETIYYQYCTAIPVGTLLAQTWDLELMEEIGEMIGEEMELFDITLWLAPGMNLHRNPLCGRNFEYYSEDPLISGKIAAAITRGVQKTAGCGTTIKHFACNNQEDNRMGSDSIVSERTLRELYLKGFEIAVKEAQPMAIMTSYNQINGIHAANHYALCTKLCRGEWGFRGIIMTDWTTTEQDESCTASGCIRAGNDLVMPGSLTDYENLRKELNEGTLSEQELRACVKRMVKVILQSNRYER